MNIEYKKLRSATNILGDFCYVQFCYSTFGCTNKSQNRKWHGRNSAGAVIKLPRHVYSPNSEASVSNDGKIPGFCKFLFLSSVIKFDNKMSEVKTKITIAQLLRLCKVKIYSPRRVRRYSSASQFFTDFGAHFVETQARFQQTCLFSWTLPA